MVRRWTSFKQDEDFEDDPDAWGLGTFYDDVGGSTPMYGYDPETASSLQQSAPPEPVMTPAPPVQSMAPPEAAAPAVPAAPATAEPATFSQRLAQAATEAGLDPSAVASLISGESGGRGDAKHPETSARGILQFTKDTWKGLTDRMGTPGVRLEDLSAEEQIPYAIEYLKGAGLGAGADAGEYKLAAISPGNVGAPDDTVLFSRETDQGKPPKAQAYRLNTWADLNDDGQVTAGEVRAVGNRASGGGPSQSRMPAASPGGVPGVPDIPGVTQGGDFRVSKMQVTGRPMSPEEMAAQKQEYAAQRDRGLAADQASRGEFMAGLEAGYDAQATGYRNQAEEAQQRMQREATARQEAANKVKAEFEAPIEKLDPQKYFKEMSGGSRLMAAIGILSGALGQAAFAMLGMQTGNTGIRMLQDAVEKNIDAQKQAIRDGKAEKGNRIRHYQEQGRSAAEAEEMARAEMLKLSEKAFLVEAEKMAAQGKDNAQAIANAEALHTEYEQKMEALRKREGDKFVIQAEAVAEADPLEAEAKRLGNLRKIEEHRRYLDPAPNYVPVGTEDSSPQAREKYVREFAYEKDNQANLSKLSEAMKPQVVREHHLAAIAEVAGLERDATGHFKNDLALSTDVVGYIDKKLQDSNWVPRERLNARDQAIADHLVALMLENRTAMTTEPNGDARQIMYELNNIPKTDKNFGAALNRLVDVTRMKEEDAFGQFSAPTRAVWKTQHDWEVGGNRYNKGKRRVTGETQ